LTTYNTNSIHWPESVSASSVSAGDKEAVDGRPDLMTAVSQLEESLRTSQQALLLHDLTSFEQQTAVQAALGRVVADCLRDRTPENCNLRLICSRVLHLGRVHLGISRRARRSLHMLSHLLSSPEAGYGSITELRAHSGKKGVSQQEG